MCLSNRLIYEGKLQCGSEEVARQALVLPHLEDWEAVHATSHDHVKAESGTSSPSCWIDDLLLERCVNCYNMIIMLINIVKLEGDFRRH